MTAMVYSGTLGLFQAKVQKGHPVPLEGSRCLVLRSWDRGVLRAQLDLSGCTEAW